MNKAPLASTIVALSLIPVAFLFIHAFRSARRKRSSHRLTGFLAIATDLSVSIGYMLYRSFRGKVGHSALNLSGGVLIYFIIHGIISLAVIVLEIAVLTTGFLQSNRRPEYNLHQKLGRVLFILWWFAFASGELFYIVTYLV